MHLVNIFINATNRLIVSYFVLYLDILKSFYFQKTFPKFSLLEHESWKENLGCIDGIEKILLCFKLIADILTSFHAVDIFIKIL